MKTSLRNAVLAISLGWGSSALGADASSPLLAPIHTFIDNFNKGDAAGAEAAYVEAPVILDEFPPHLWQGPGAFKSWAGDLMKTDAAAGMSHEAVVLGAPVRAESHGESGYVVIHATFNWTETRGPMTEPAEMVYSLKKIHGAWKIAGWAWTGGLPRPAAKN